MVILFRLYGFQDRAGLNDMTHWHSSLRCGPCPRIDQAPRAPIARRIIFHSDFTNSAPLGWHHTPLDRSGSYAAAPGARLALKPPSLASPGPRPVSSLADPFWWPRQAGLHGVECQLVVVGATKTGHPAGGSVMRFLLGTCLLAVRKFWSRRSALSLCSAA